MPYVEIDQDLGTVTPGIYGRQPDQIHNIPESIRWDSEMNENVCNDICTNYEECIGYVTRGNVCVPLQYNDKGAWIDKDRTVHTSQTPREFLTDWKGEFFDENINIKENDEYEHTDAWKNLNLNTDIGEYFLELVTNNPNFVQIYSSYNLPAHICRKACIENSVKYNNEIEEFSSMGGCDMYQHSAYSPDATPEDDYYRPCVLYKILDTGNQDETINYRVTPSIKYTAGGLKTTSHVKMIIDDSPERGIEGYICNSKVGRCTETEKKDDNIYTDKEKCEKDCKSNNTIGIVPYHIWNEWWFCVLIIFMISIATVALMLFVVPFMKKYESV